jgi:hypothetical protein
LLCRWFWPLAWAWLRVRSLLKTPLLTPLKAQKLPLKVPKLLLKAQWKPLKAPLTRPLPALTLLLPVPWKLPAPLATLPLPLAMPLLPQRKKLPSKFSNLLSVWGRHPQGWRPFPFVRHWGRSSPMKLARLTCVSMCLTLAACGADGDAPGAGGMTVGENARLEAAAERLEGRTPSPAQPAAAQLEAEVTQGIAAEQQSTAPAQ